jgi:DNA-binding Lrp family transcriptional regulator
MGAKPPVELAKVEEVGQFLRKFVNRDARKSLQVISVLAQVGWYDELEPEAKVVAKFVGISVPALRTEVKKLRDQGVVIRKGRYLYVSPELLAIKAAADLWSEKDYGLLDLISKLKGREPRSQLLIRLATMGEYPEMREAVGRVVSKDGLFPTLEQLDQEFLSEVFRILSSAVPIAAANLLTELIVPATKDDLLRFKTGRRNVMWAIESLLRWPETSMKAARALMKFALSETEKIANNATSSFETFFHVFLSGSPVPLLERFALIDELLESDDSHARLLATRAAAGSLESHETRFGPDTDHLSKRPYPPEWRPTTYGDIWEARRMAIKYLEQIGKGNDEAATVARRELLQSPFALVSQGQVDDAIRILESAVPMNDEERRNIVRSCDQINRVPNLTDEQRARVKQIRDSAFGTTYFERLRRWVGGRLPEDFDLSSASGYDAADRHVMELAEEGFKNGIGEAEIKWLSSPEAENVWPFGRRLGEIDQQERFRDRIFQAAPDDQNCMLLAAYIWGRSAAFGPENRERLLDALLQTKPIAAFGATWRGDATVAGAIRIINLVSAGRVPASSLSMLRYGGWVTQLPTEYAIEIINTMLRLNPESNAEAVLGIIDHAVRAHSITVEQLGDAIWEALEIKGTQRSPSFDWHWGRVADLVATRDPGRLACVFLTLFESGDTWLGTDSAQSALEHATRSNPHSVWEVIGAALLKDDLIAVRLRLKLGQWFGELIPSEMLVDWAQRHGRRGFLTAAELLNAKGDQLSDSARLLVKTATNPREILNQLFANLQTGGFMGPVSSHLEAQLATLKNWARDKDPTIRSWAEAAIAYAEKGVKRQKLLEEEGRL